MIGPIEKEKSKHLHNYIRLKTNLQNERFNQKYLNSFDQESETYGDAMQQVRDRS